MRSAHDQALSVLAGLPLGKIARTADMLSLHFGQLREVPAHRGKVGEVGDWALHVQTSWRFVRNGRILMGVLDLYAYAEDGSDYDWDRGGESRFDRIAAALQAELRGGEMIVRGVVCDEVGSISIDLRGELRFEVFPNWSSDYPDREYWRFFQPATELPHYVVRSGRL